MSHFSTNSIHQVKKLQTKNNISLFEKHPKLTLTLLLFIFIVLLDILAASLFSALGLYSPQFKIERYYRLENKIYHHTLAKNISHSDAKWGPIGYRVNTNSLGFKDNQPRKVPLKKQDQRLLIIGDSFTEGLGYEHNDTFVGIIDKELNNKNIEVFNAGVSSYSPIIYYRKTKDLIEQGFEFDHLLVLIDISDIENEARHYTLDENGNVVNKTTAKSNELDERIKRFITENTIILSNLRILIRKLRNRNKKQRKFEDSLNVYGGMWTVDQGVYDDYGKEGISSAKKYMTMLAKLLQKNNIKLSVAVYPWPDQIFHKDLNSKQVKIWKNWSNKHNADFINLFPKFINNTEGREIINDYFILGDVHWNKEGHKLIAKSLLEYINK